MNSPKRIICLTEESTELLYLLGEENRIVGISAYTVRPPQAKKNKPVVSAFLSGHIERIQSLKPDLVIGFSDIQADLARSLIQRGLNVLVTNQRTIEEIFQSIFLLGSIVGKVEQTEKLISAWREKLRLIERSVEGLPHPKVFFQEWDDPIIHSIQWVGELIEICGGENCFPISESHSMAKDRIVSAQTVGAKNPELIVASWCGKKVDENWILSRPEWQNTTAIRRKQIVEMDPSIILQPGPALFLEGVDQLKVAIDRVRNS